MRDDENTFWARHKDALQAVLVPRVFVGSVRDNVTVTTWTIVTTSWDKRANKMRMRKTCARTVYCLHLPSNAGKRKSLNWNDKKTTVRSRLKISTNPSSTLTTGRCLVAIAMTKMMTNALWKKDSVAIL